MNKQLILHKIGNHPLLTALCGVLFLSVSFLLLEPKIGQSQTTFTVTQQITGETSFLVQAANVTMISNIAGLTGGHATGTTVTSVETNNPTGYNMTLQFSSTTAMKHQTASATIANYTPATPGTADFTFQANAVGESAEFGYTVRASSSGEVATTFMNNGSACGVSTSETDDRCWLNPTSTVAQTIVNSAAPSNSSTTTIKFRVSVPQSPSPVLPTGFYVATGTLTITAN